jgi:hypothetical protein
MSRRNRHSIISARRAPIPTILAQNLFRLQRTLEQAGVVFIDADASGGVGVRLRS